jgi:hypothetical protein
MHAGRVVQAVGKFIDAGAGDQALPAVLHASQDTEAHLSAAHAHVDGQSVGFHFADFLCAHHGPEQDLRGNVSLLPFLLRDSCKVVFNEDAHQRISCKLDDVPSICVNDADQFSYVAIGAHLKAIDSFLSGIAESF